MKTLFGQYSETIRSQALRVLSQDMGIHCWSHDFDPNSPTVLNVCAGIEEGETDFTPKPKPMYTWTPEMVTAYQNHVDGTSGKRMSALPNYRIPFGWSHV